MNPIDYDRLHQYLRREMSEDEKLKFEQECTREPALAEALEIERDAMALLRYAGRSEMKARLRRPPPTPIRKPFMRSRTIAKAAVAAAAALALTWIVTLLVRPPKHEREANRYFALGYQPDFDSILRGSSDTSSSQLAQASKDYKAGAFRTALERLRHTKPTDENQAAGIALIQGDCYFRLNELDSAMAAYETAMYTHSIVSRTAQWHLGLAKWKAGDQKGARTVLEQLLKVEGDNLGEKMTLLIREVLQEL